MKSVNIKLNLMTDGAKFVQIVGEIGRAHV